MLKLRSMFGMNKLPASVDKTFRDHLKTLDNVLTVAIKETSECYFCTDITIQCPKSNDILLFEVFFEFVKDDTRKAGKERMRSSIYVGYLSDKKIFSKRGASKSDILKAYEQCVCDTYHALTRQKSPGVIVHQLNDKLVLENEAYFDSNMFDVTVTSNISESVIEYNLVENTFKTKINSLFKKHDASVDAAPFTYIHNVLLDDLKNSLKIRPNADWTPEKYELGSGDVSHIDRIKNISILSKPFTERSPKSYHAILLKAPL